MCSLSLGKRQLHAPVGSGPRPSFPRATHAFHQQILSALPPVQASQALPTLFRATTSTPPSHPCGCNSNLWAPRPNSTRPLCAFQQQFRSGHFSVQNRHVLIIEPRSAPGPPAHTLPSRLPVEEHTTTTTTPASAWPAPHFMCISDKAHLLRGPFQVHPFPLLVLGCSLARPTCATRM